MNRNRARPAPVPDWWVGEGEEPCPFCLQGYDVHLELRCRACDTPGCLHCVTRMEVTGRVSCPPCRDGGESAGATAAGSP